MDIISQFKEKARKLNGTIVLPESEDIRTLKAAEQITRESLAKVVLLGSIDDIQAKTRQENISLEGIEIINPDNYGKITQFEELFYEKRKEKGITYEDAKHTVRQPLFFGALLVKTGVVNGMVAGALNTTSDVLKAALQVIGTNKSFTNTVSSSFIMVAKDFMGQGPKIFLFADCAVIPNPTPEQLADIAYSTAVTRAVLIEDAPKVALLSFSTKGSAQHELVDKVLAAKDILTKRNVKFEFDGELQLDAAIVEKVGRVKAPDSKIAGVANVLIFPDLQSANIGYKLVERFAGVEAIGPVIQGLAAPVCDLSRGCSVSDIVATSALVLLLSKIK